MVPAVNQNRGLHLYTSNRLELLAEALARVTRKPLPDPFQAEAVVVQSLGMERWLKQRLARYHGICANFSCIFPQALVAGLMETALPGRANPSLFNRENLTWRIMSLLPTLVRQKEFGTLRRYLSRSRPELRRFQLAERIARSFDRYLVFRPQMIRGWETGAENHWQAILWRELVKTIPGLHPPALADEFRSLLKRGAAPLPERISLFGISTLPPFYVDFLRELAGHTAVHLFVMRPTPDWWEDIRSERAEMRARRKVPETAQLDLKFERGNPLLASLGKLGREFLTTVTELDPTSEHEQFDPPDNSTILSQLQREIFRLDDPSTGPKRSIEANDSSVQLHSCHSPMREMEVLHDQLLAIFETFPDLKPHDIVVMAPDISIYAPFVEAVFDTAPEALRIPFSISDRGARAENGVIDTFFRILETAGSRLGASEVMSILESAPLQRRFSLTEPDLEVIRTWIEKTGVRWGIDAAHRVALGLPEFGENSWRTGLDRLLLGYAAPARGEQLFAGILAFDEVEGSLAETLGHFAEFADVLFATARDLEKPRSLGEWQERLRDISLRFFPSDDDREPELHELRRVLESLGKTADLSGFAEPIPLEVLREHLERSLASAERPSGFLAGRVTFCALKPMRAVPFRVVCLVGMNDTAYPRRDRPPTFDLIAQHPRTGDRTTRDDDRYLFLEALLSARDIFYVSYVGQSIRDNSAIPPSVLVSDLIDYTGVTPVAHPLQPFSERYFTGRDGLFSYSKENCAASQVSVEERRSPPVFMTAPIAEPEPEWCRLDTAQLISFFGHPAKFFLEQRLGLRLPRMERLLDDSEPQEIEGIPKYQLQQELLARAIRGEPLDPILPVLRARGELPPGHAGDAELREIREVAEHFAGLVRQHMNDTADDPRSVQQRLGQFELSARLDRLHDGRLVRYRLTTRKPKDLLASWIDHLVANCESETESVLITTDKDGKPVVEKFLPLETESANRHLTDLLEHYWRGLTQPLPLFPRTSLAYVEQMLRPRGKRSPIEVARAKWKHPPETWEPDKGERPESEDPYFQVAFRHVADPLDETWEKLALAVFVPPVKAVRP